MITWLYDYIIYVVDILCVNFCYIAYACILSLPGGSIKYCRIDMMALTVPNMPIKVWVASVTSSG